MTDYEQYYHKSMDALEEYIYDKRQIPTEKQWNRHAIENSYLSSQTIGYMSGMKFPDLCKKMYKEMQKRRKGLFR